MVILGETDAFGNVRFTISIRDRNGDIHELPAILDTGYEGYVTLPSELAQTLGLTANGTERITLGDGKEVDVDIIPVSIVWEEHDRRLRALIAPGLPLIGIRLLRGLVGTFHFSDGGPAILFRP